MKNWRAMDDGSGVSELPSTRGADIVCESEQHEFNCGTNCRLVLPDLGGDCDPDIGRSRFCCNA